MAEDQQNSSKPEAIGKMAENIAADPWLRAIVKWRNELFWLVVVFICAVILWDVYRDTRREEARQSSDVFFAVRKDLGTLDQQEQQLASLSNQGQSKNDDTISDDADPKDTIENLRRDIADTQARLNGKLKMLAEASSPYNEGGRLYEQALMVREKDLAGLRAVLEEYGAWRQQEGWVRLVHELGLLQAARALLDSTADLVRGREVLISLAQDGEYVAVSAGLALSRTSSNDEQRKEAVSVLRKIIKRSPEQHEIISNELLRLEQSMPELVVQ